MEPKRLAEIANTNGGPFIWPSLLPRDGQGNANNTPLRWRLGSRLVVPTVGLFSKFWMTVANTSTVHNADVFHRALQDNYEAWQQQQHQQRAHHRRSSSCPADARRDQHNSQLISGSLATVSASNGRKSSSASQGFRPLITYSNHSSCLDDPLMWGALLPLRWQFNSNRHRWSAAAAEICFAGRLHALFFSLGKTFPIIRGEGIYQPAMDYAANLMRSGVWMHFFPEGKVIPRLEKADPALLKFKYDENGKPLTNEPKEGEPSTLAAMVMKKRSTNSEPSLCDRLVSLVEQQSYSLKWGMARLIIEHVLGEGATHDDHYSDICSPSKSSSYSTEVGIDTNRPPNVLPEVDVLPIYHMGMDDVLPTRHPYIPRMFNKVTFLVRPEGPIRIDRNFLLKLFDVDGDDQMTKSNGAIIPRKFELSLTEKRIRLMRFLEDELNQLSSKAQWLHEKWNTTNNSNSNHDQQRQL